jgi:hypothetical protein
VVGLVGVELCGELLVGGRNAGDAHVPGEPAVVVGGGDLLVPREASPAELVDPADRDRDERTEHIEHVGVREL